MLSCEICEIFKNTYSEEHLQRTASAECKPGSCQTYLEYSQTSMIELSCNDVWVNPKDTSEK